MHLSKYVQVLATTLSVAGTGYGNRLLAQRGSIIDPDPAAMCTTNTRMTAGNGFMCNAQGALSKPAVLQTGSTASVSDCAEFCRTEQPNCISFSYGPGRVCTTYAKKINQMGYKKSSSGKAFYNRRCISRTCTCPDTRTNCNGTCFNLQTSGTNCGSCGNSCGTGVCQAGTCIGRCVLQGKTECDGVCVNTSTDRTNCGSCGTMCELDESCDNGVCTEPID